MAMRIFASLFIVAAWGVTLEPVPEPEPLACYGVAPYCSYPQIQCCIDNAWACCRKGF
jgi:hypothetical protein